MNREQIQYISKIDVVKQVLNAAARTIQKRPVSCGIPIGCDVMKKSTVQNLIIAVAFLSPLLPGIAVASLLTPSTFWEWMAILIVSTILYYYVFKEICRSVPDKYLTMRW